ncbi:MAG: histidine phosphatase family protein [Gemmatimonadetes bacterium]|nr:histidine phosphatase family protein [Gemmatimonadota bacterium]MYB56457.1 histidine phosphatase family protein [Gemmatimonadota bacterium]
MNHLILIKHAQPQIDKTKSAPDWHLSDSGRASCIPLAEALRPYKPDLLITSEEPKARETGQLVAEALQIPYTLAPNFHEHDRKGVPFISPETWHSIVKTFFARPNALIFGNETAHQARLRFTQAIEKAVKTHPRKTIAIATHGTVISLFTAQKTRTNGFDLWQQLNLPSYVVFDLPDYNLNTIVTEIF